MLPTGHFAAGLLIGKAIVGFSGIVLAPEQTNIIVWLTAFFAFSPDLDMFYSFYLLKSFSKFTPATNHRGFITHAPALWLTVSLPFIIFGNPFWQAIGLSMWFGSWSHFLLDSIQHGIMWLWPFSKKKYALLSTDIDHSKFGSGFFNFWLKFLHAYVTVLWPTFVLEILIFLTLLIVYTSYI